MILKPLPEDSGNRMLRCCSRYVVSCDNNSIASPITCLLSLNSQYCNNANIKISHSHWANLIVYLFHYWALFPRSATVYYYVVLKVESALMCAFLCSNSFWFVSLHPFLSLFLLMMEFSGMAFAWLSARFVFKALSLCVTFYSFLCCLIAKFLFHLHSWSL